MSCIRFCSNRAYHVGTGSTIQTTVLDENGTLRATQRNAVCIMYKDIISQIVGVFQCAQANNNQILLYFEPLTLASTGNRERKRASKNEWDWVFWGHTQTMVCLYIRLPSHLLFDVHNILRRSLCVCVGHFQFWSVMKVLRFGVNFFRPKLKHSESMRWRRAAYTQRSMGRERRKAREKTTIQLAMEINLCGFQQCVVCNIEERTANTIISASLVGISHPDSLHLPSPEKAW